MRLKVWDKKAKAPLVLNRQKVDINFKGRAMKKMVLSFPLWVLMASSLYCLAVRAWPDPGPGVYCISIHVGPDYLSEITAGVKFCVTGMVTQNRIWVKKSPESKRGLDEMNAAYAALHRLYRSMTEEVSWDQFERL